MKDIPYILRAYEEGDEEGIKTLFRQVYGWCISEEEWQWRYLLNPTRVMAISLAEANNKIIGQYASLPVFVRFKGKDLLAAQIVNLMVHPDYRSQGLFVAMGNQFHKEACKKGISLIYCFPNESSAHGFFDRLGWQKACWTPFLFRPLKAPWPLKRFFGSPRASQKSSHKAHITELHHFDERFDVFWEKVKDDYPIMIRRDSTYLNWRYVQKPGADYSMMALEREGQILAFLVVGTSFKMGKKIGIIAEMMSLKEPSISIEPLLEGAMAFFHQKGVSLCGCLMLRDKQHYETLRRWGFWPTPFNLFSYAGILRKKSYFGARSTSPTVPNEFLKDKSNWYISWGDGDTV